MTVVTPSAVRTSRVAMVRESPVYLVTEESLSEGRATESVVAAALDAGVRIVQLREKGGHIRRALHIGEVVRRLTAAAGALLIVNDRVDLALAVGADGVHVGQDDLPLEVVRAMVGPDAVIGLSITAYDQLAAADARAADYLGVGSIYPTGSKGDAALTGLTLLRQARGIDGAPIVAIGGITVANAPEVVMAGADSVAVITAITAAADPREASRALVAAVTAAREARRHEVGSSARVESA